MTHLFIQNEGDMEHGLMYVVEVAKYPSASKKIIITFPSEGLAKIFTHNLFKDFILNKIPRDSGLDLTVEIPAE